MCLQCPRFYQFRLFAQFCFNQPAFVELIPIRGGHHEAHGGPCVAGDVCRLAALIQSLQSLWRPHVTFRVKGKERGGFQGHKKPEEFFTLLSWRRSRARRHQRPGGLLWGNSTPGFSAALLQPSGIQPYCKLSCRVFNNAMKDCQPGVQKAHK